MQTYVLNGTYQQVATAGAVVAQGKGGGTIMLALNATQPADGFEGFELKPENENLFASNTTVPLWAKSSAEGARLVVSIDGA